MSENTPAVKSSLRDVMQRIRVRILPTVLASTPLDGIIDAFERSRHSHILYAIDEQNRFLGIIDVKDISKHVLFHYHETAFGSRGLIRVATSESAQDFIKKEKCSATAEEDFESVLERMLSNKADEIPVLSAEGELLGDITIVDMIDFYVYKTGRDRLGIDDMPAREHV